MRSLRNPVLLLAIALAVAGPWALGCKGRHQADQVLQLAQVHVDVPAEGLIRVDDQPVEDVRDHLIAALASGEIPRDAPVVVIGDAETTWERLREAYGEVLAAGLRNVKIARRGVADAPADP